MHTTVEILRCPICGATLSHTVRHNGLQAAGTSIGPATIPCPGCNTEVYTGQSEWNEKSLWQKSMFLLSRLLWLVVASIVVAGMFAICVGWIAVEGKFISPAQRWICVLISYVVGMVLIDSVLIRNALKEIRASRLRTADLKSNPIGTTEGSTRVYFAVEEFRGADRKIVCGLRRLENDEPPDAPFVLETSSHVAAKIEFTANLHLRSSNYDVSTSRIVGIIVGTSEPAKLYRVGEDGSLLFTSTFDDSIWSVEFAGPEANRAEREQFDNRILVYPPLGV